MYKRQYGGYTLPCLTAQAVVVGSGCAALNAADCLAAQGMTDILLVTEDFCAGTSRNTGSDKQTYYKLSLCGEDGDSVGELARTLYCLLYTSDVYKRQRHGQAPNAAYPGAPAAVRRKE